VHPQPRRDHLRAGPAGQVYLGFTGPRQEAEQIKACIGQFLHDQLELELSPAKTLITRRRTQAARFLGYEIVVLHADHKQDQRGHRSINAAIGLKVPADVIRAKCAARAYIERQHERLASGDGHSFAIVDAATGDAVGQIGLWLKNLADGRASTGYGVASQFRRRGYVTAALAAISHRGLSVAGIHRIELYVEPWNDGSWRAAECAGYVTEGLLRSWQQVGHERRDTYSGYGRHSFASTASGRARRVGARRKAMALPVTLCDLRSTSGAADHRRPSK
jgi:hypothetical protein